MPGKTNSSGLTFTKWKSEVNSEIMGLLGLHADDLPDKDYRSMWDSDLSPKEAALEVLEDEGFEVSEDTE